MNGPAEFIFKGGYPKSMQLDNVPKRWLLSIALCIPTAHDFRVISARKLAPARAQLKKFPSS